MAQIPSSPELPVSISNFLICKRFRRTAQGNILYYPATEEIELKGSNPHAYFELRGGQIVSVAIYVWGLTTGAAQSFGPYTLEPMGSVDSFAIPLHLAPLPLGRYHVGIWLGDQPAIERELEIKP